MQKYLLSLALCGFFIINSSSVIAETEPYYATGEDIDNLIEDNDTSVLIEIEQELSKFSLFRKLEKYLYNVVYFDSDEEAEIHIINDDE